MISFETVIGLVNNAALLVTLVLIYDIVVLRRPTEKAGIGQLPLGVVLGTIGIFIMLNPWEFLPGIIFDTRTVLLSVSGLFFGTLPTVTAALMLAGYRLFLGGGGVIPGIATILTASAIGILWRHARKPQLHEVSGKELYLLGLVTHIAMLLCMFTMPVPVAFEVLKNIGVPVILLLPIVTFLIGKLMTNRIQRIKAIEALEESENKFSTIFYDHKAIELIIEPETGTIADANKAAERFYGWSHEQLRQMSIQQINTLSPGQIMEEMEKAKVQERSFFEFQHRLADGSICDVEVYSSPVVIGNTTYLHSIVHDITERKRIERELANQQNLFETMFNSIPDGVVITDTERKIVVANEGIRTVFGYTPDELVGKTTKLLYADRENFSRAGKEIFNQDSPGNGELFITRYKKRSGEIFPGETFGAKLYDDSGRWLGNLAVMRDISHRQQQEEERIQLQQQLMQAQKMEAIGTLAGGIAHDFNNILGVIMGYAEMANDASPPGSLLASDTQQIITAGNRAKELVKQILAFSRQSESEQISIAPTVLLKEILKLLRATIPSTITLEYSFSETDHIMADPIKIHQVIMNLCTNAFHALEEKGGTLSLELDQVELGQKELEEHHNSSPGNYIHLAVIDDGPGISAEIRRKIFDPYFTTKEVGKGTGMGLAIVHGIVSGYGGFVRCQSEIGRGTAFHLYLPTVSENTEVTSEEKPGEVAGSEHILFVDDEPELAEMSRMMLTRLGYTVTVRTSSIEALAAFENHPEDFDLVITDQTMPGMTGFDLARRILQLRPDIPIILCTGFSAVISKEKALAAGIKGFAEKPLVRKEIGSLIRTVLAE